MQRDQNDRKEYMHDFGKIAYLDLHKTGSSFVSKFLRKCCTLRRIREAKHDWVREDYRENCIYFISIRKPIAMYSSLYRFGLQEIGGVYMCLRRTENLHAYRSFSAFVEFCTEPENASLLGDQYNPEISSQIGFMSFRYLKLSLQYPMTKIRNKIEFGNNISDLKSEFIWDFEMKQENLAGDLRMFSTELYPEYFDQSRARAFLDNQEIVNASKVRSREIDELPRSLVDHISQKEALLMARY